MVVSIGVTVFLVVPSRGVVGGLLDSHLLVGCFVWRQVANETTIIEIKAPKQSVAL